MSKDPAFLFYSNDFYEGTRTMLPEERACLIDLLIYQHQHGEIPSEIKRLSMYCSGCSEETIKNVLNQKFSQTDNGWLNQKLNHLVSERSNHRPKKIAAAVLAGCISRGNLSLKNNLKIKKQFKIDDFIKDKEGLTLSDSDIKDKVKKWFNHLVNHLVNNIENENENENKDKKEKGVKGKKEKELVYPWTSEEFKKAWGVWLDYKKKEFNFRFKSSVSEQAALHNLQQISTSESNAIEIINQSIVNSWKGLFKLKSDGKQQHIPSRNEIQNAVSNFLGTNKAS